MLLAGRGTRGAPNNAADDKTNGAETLALEKKKVTSDFDRRLKQLVHDRRSQPTNRTKTDEEMVQEESERLKELEEKRLKRMRGESVSDDDSSGEDEEADRDAQAEPAFQFLPTEQEEDWGLGVGIKSKSKHSAGDLPDEDSFVIDDDLVASGSDLEPIDSDAEEEEDEEDDEDMSGSEQEQDDGDESDDEFTKGLLTEEEAKSSVFLKGTVARDAVSSKDELPYSFPCPQTHEELAALAQKYPIEKLPTIM